MEEKSVIKIPIGLKNGEPVHISQIEKLDLHGRDCKCVCPGCKFPLEARISKSKSRRSYFAHVSNNSCSSQHAYETGIHLFSKKIISEKSKLLFPAIMENASDIPELLEINDQYYGQLSDYGFLDVLNIKPEKMLDLDAVEIEKTFGNVKPDLIVYSGENICFVEIAVTHFIDEAKKEKLIELNYPVIEIDLSECRDLAEDLESLEHEIIDNPKNRKWIYYPRLEKGRERAIIKRKEKIKNIDSETIKKHNKFIEKYQNELKRLRNDELAYKTIKKLHFYKELSNSTLPFYLDIPISGEVYINCDRRIWQSLIFDKFVYYRNDGEISFNTIKSWLENYNDTIKINWKFGDDNKITAKMFYETIKKYLRYLSFLGFISPIYDCSKNGHFVFDAALWNSRSLNVLDKYSERSKILSKSIKMVSRENINPDEYIERVIYNEFCLELYTVTTSNSPSDWIK